MKTMLYDDFMQIHDVVDTHYSQRQNISNMVEIPSHIDRIMEDKLLLEKLM